MNIIDIKIGDKIKDQEDGDCWFEGIIVELNPVKYKITSIYWNGEIDNSLNGTITRTKWWIFYINDIRIKSYI